jgi:hypothetical protein
VENNETYLACFFSKFKERNDKMENWCLIGKTATSVFVQVSDRFLCDEANLMRLEERGRERRGIRLTAMWTTADNVVH